MLHFAQGVELMIKNNTSKKTIFKKGSAIFGVVVSLLLGGCGPAKPPVGDEIVIKNPEDVLNPKGIVTVDGKTYDRAKIKEVCGGLYAFCEPLSEEEILNQFKQILLRHKIQLNLVDKMQNGTQEGFFTNGYYYYEDLYTLLQDRLAIIQNDYAQSVPEITHEYANDIKEYFSIKSNGEYSIPNEMINFIADPKNIDKFDDLVSNASLEEKEDVVRIKNFYEYTFIEAAKAVNYPLKNYFEEKK